MEQSFGMTWQSLTRRAFEKENINGNNWLEESDFDDKRQKEDDINTVLETYMGRERFNLVLTSKKKNGKLSDYARGHEESECSAFADL